MSRFLKADNKKIAAFSFVIEEPNDVLLSLGSIAVGIWLLLSISILNIQQTDFLCRKKRIQIQNMVGDFNGVDFQRRHGFLF